MVFRYVWRVKVELLSADAVKIKIGTPVFFERWGGDPALSGKVRVIEPAGFQRSQASEWRNKGCSS